MKFFSARRALSAGVVAAASVAAFAVPSAASAALPGHCKGTSTEGAGSSFQLEAEELFRKGFNANKSVGCVGVGSPEITKYRSVGSGAGYKEWAVKELYGTVGFVGTDNTVNAAEKAVVEGQVDEGKTSSMLTIPLLQGAEAIVVNVPTGCTANSKVAAGRLGINQKTLEGIYEGTVTKWSEILGTAAGQENTGNELTGAECKPEEDAIIPVVRADGSGTTHIFKKFLFQINGASFAIEGGGEQTWGELAEGASSTKWPTAAGVFHPAETTNTGVLKAVAEKPGSIGYADLAQARNPANGGFTGQSASRFWTVLESERSEKTTSKGIKIKSKYKDPSTDGDSATTAESNCKKTEFSNGKGSFPPPSVSAPWNEVGAKQFSKSYALCGLTYVFALSNYSAYASHGGNAEEAQTARDYIAYATSKKGGAKEIKGHDYAALPKSLIEKAEEGVTSIED